MRGAMVQRLGGLRAGRFHVAGEFRYVFLADLTFGQRGRVRLDPGANPMLSALVNFRACAWFNGLGDTLVLVSVSAAGAATPVGATVSLILLTAFLVFGTRLGTAWPRGFCFSFERLSPRHVKR